MSNTSKSIYSLLIVLLLNACSSEDANQQTTTSTAETEVAVVEADSMANDNLSGIVSSANGPEAGVWVIAETDDLDTDYVKIVVTNDNGEYLLPDLPDANYQVWVRGYGLVDSEQVQATPGMTLDLQAVVAPNETAAAQYYPAGYWYSMLDIPEAIVQIN
jgi:hypothetical protein